MDRRRFIVGMCAGGLATMTVPLLSLAQVPGKSRLVFVLLRGGLDGLAAVVPYGDKNYAGLRGRMAFEKKELVPLEDGFGLAPGLQPWQSLWKENELVAVHALAIPYRTRSHFDGQAVLETGLGEPRGTSDGWMNRLLQVMAGERSGIAVAAGLPRSLSGSFPVTTWSPARLGVVEDSYIDRLHLLYRRDSRLLDRFEAALQLSDKGMTAGMGGGRRARMEPIMRAAARFLRDPGGPNVAAVEFSGWDTHTNQGMAGGPLDRLLGQLAQGVLAFKDEIREAWKDTILVIMTEFGRTARPNGGAGTDHGTAGAAFVIGPKVARSRVIADWPGLGNKQLYENRDLRPSLDTRALLKGALAGCFDLTSSQLNRIFPGSDSVAPRWDLLG
ncbi:MAG: DUF1501 domain-containing protein [Acidobacteriota bacterium]